MKNQRPVNLNLLSIRFPITAIASIGHRISGVILFLCVPFLLYMLECTLSSKEAFIAMLTFMQLFWVKLCVWGIGVALIYHCIAGIRHLLMDVGIGEHLPAAKMGAVLVMVSSGILALIWAVWLWAV